MRSIHIQKDKSTFKLSEYPAEKYAASMGLPGAPQIKLLEKSGKNQERGAQKNDEDTGPTVIHQRLAETDSEDEDDEDSEDDEGDDSESGEESDASGSGSGSGSDAPAPKQAPAVRTKYDRMFERKNQSILTPHYSKLVAHDDDLAGAEDDDDDVFTLARRDHDLDGADSDEDFEGVKKPLISSEDLSKRKLKEGTTRKGQLKNRGMPTKVVFGEDGEARDFYEHGDDVEAGAGAEEVRRAFVEAESARMREADIVDREVAREKRREKKRKRKEREREVSETTVPEVSGCYRWCRVFGSWLRLVVVTLVSHTSAAGQVLPVVSLLRCAVYQGATLHASRAKRKDTHDEAVRVGLGRSVRPAVSWAAGHNLIWTCDTQFAPDLRSFYTEAKNHDDGEIQPRVARDPKTSEDATDIPQVMASMMGGDEGGVAYLGGSGDESGGSDAGPGFDYDSDAAGSAASRSASPEPAARPSKKRRAAEAELEDDEELALRLLRGN